MYFFMKFTKLILSFLFLFSITIYSQDYNQTKKNIVKSIENHEDEIIKISDKIWELAEEEADNLPYLYNELRPQFLEGNQQVF